MGLSDLPLVSMLKTRLEWHQTRQKILAENVANANTPGFRPRDLRDPVFTPAGDGSAGLGVSRTNPLHLASAGAGNGGAEATRADVFERTPSGNAVNLEDQMMKVASNQSDYQLAASLYGKSLAMLRMAAGAKG